MRHRIHEVSSILLYILVILLAPCTVPQGTTVASWIDTLTVDVVRRDPRSFDSWDMLEVRQVELFIDDVFSGMMQSTVVFHDFMEDYANK